jgi:hypothetical protein
MLIQYIEERFLKKKRRSNILETLLLDLSAVFVWRGTWGLMDKYLFPTHPDISFIFSILLGIALVFIIRQYNRT